MTATATAARASDRAPERDRLLRIGELAELTGTTPRTIRYYEEIGLLPSAPDREHGQRRLYDAAGVERLQQIVRLRDLLGLSLDQLKALLHAETARAALRREWQHADADAERRRILNEALGHVGGQIELVRRRQVELERLETELAAKQRSLRARRRQLR